MRVAALTLLACAALGLGVASSGWGVAPDSRYEIGLFGDTPYSIEEEVQFKRALAHANQAPLAFAVHVGDFKSGGAPCDDQAYRHAKELLNGSRHPLILVPGDNDWTDCYRKACGEFDPLERLNVLRKILFADGQSFGQRTIKLEQQSQIPRFAAYREHTRWQQGAITYVGLNVPGSNNNYGRSRAMDQEFYERQEAYMAWMRESFDLARSRRSKGIMLFIQANPQFDKKWGERTGYNDFLGELQRLTESFGKPVALVHGDTHYFRVDKPMTRSDKGHIVPNFTRVETFGSPNVHWIRAVIDERDPNLFRFEPQLVAENVGQL